jgi:hypothetical protein
MAFAIDIDRIDSTLDAGRPLSELTELFPNQLEALHYYARWAQHRHLQVGCKCELCGREEKVHERVCSWQTIVHPDSTVPHSVLTTAVSIFGAHIVTKCHRVHFQSHHAICGSCSRGLKVRRGAAQFLRYLFFAVMFVALFVAVVTSVMMIATALQPGGMDRTMMGGLVTSLGALGVCGLVFAYCRYLSIPAGMRETGKYPFSLESVQ